MKAKEYEAITQVIIKDLESGVAPWTKPWQDNGLGQLPYNAESKRHYSGINVLLTWAAQSANGWSSAGWLTFKQAKNLGGHVRKGEKGTRVYFANHFEKETEDGETEEIWYLRPFTVFNVEQIEGLAECYYTKPEPVSEVIRVEQAEEFIQSIPAEIRHGGNSACFTPSLDVIKMPNASQFSDTNSYYATVLHELVHWTGHKARLDRDMTHRFGSEAYAFEELIAELGCAFLCAEIGIQGQLQHSEYIGSWIKVLKDDPKAVITAARQATAAVKYLKEHCQSDELKKVA
jgi:antirestriction protein ArdC